MRTSAAVALIRLPVQRGASGTTRTSPPCIDVGSGPIKDLIVQIRAFRAPNVHVGGGSQGVVNRGFFLVLDVVIGGRDADAGCGSS